MDLSWWSTSYSIFYDLSVDQMVAWAEAMGIESVVIDENTDIRILKNELRWNEVFIVRKWSSIMETSK